MMQPRLTFAVLSLFVAGLVSGAVGEALHSLTSPDHAYDCPKSACPDSGDDGSPCGPSCACTCCPGHANAVAFAPVRLSVTTPPNLEPASSLPDGLHPQDFLIRIFHPPRA